MERIFKLFKMRLSNRDDAKIQIDFSVSRCEFHEQMDYGERIPRSLDGAGNPRSLVSTNLAVLLRSCSSRGLHPCRRIFTSEDIDISKLLRR